MSILISLDIDSSKLLLYGIVTIIFLSVLTSGSHNGKKSKSSIPHAPRIPYKLPFGLDMAWKLVKRLHSNTFVEYVCEEVLNTPGRTIEMNLLGGDIFITDRAENIKAIQESCAGYACRVADMTNYSTP